MSIVISRRAHLIFYETGSEYGTQARLEGLTGAVEKLRELFQLKDNVMDSYFFHIFVMYQGVVVVRRQNGQVLVRLMTVETSSGKILVGILEDGAAEQDFFRAGLHETRLVPTEAQPAIMVLEGMRSSDSKRK